MVVPAGKAACTQRAGRAGRVRPGRCFRLCTEDTFGGLNAAAAPEMQRSELTGTVLQLKALGIDNLLDFEVGETRNPRTDGHLLTVWRVLRLLAR